MNNQFWNQLFTMASSVGQADETKESALARLEEQLETIEVMYRGSFDPADNFEEYVAVALCNAVNKAISQSRQTEERSCGKALAR